MTEPADPFTLSSPDETELSAAGRMRRAAIREQLQSRVAARGRMRRNRQVVTAGLCAAAALVAIAIWKPASTATDPNEVAPVARGHEAPRIEHLEPRASPRIVSVPVDESVVDRLRARPGRVRVVGLANEDLGSWLRAFGRRPARLQIGGRSIVFDIEGERAED